MLLKMIFKIFVLFMSAICQVTSCVSQKLQKDSYIPQDGSDVISHPEKCVYYRLASDANINKRQLRSTDENKYPAQWNEDYGFEVDHEITKSDIYTINWYDVKDPIILTSNSSKSIILKIHIKSDPSDANWIPVIIIIHLICTLGQIVVSCVYYFYERLETKKIRKMTMMYCSQPGEIKA
jgi:hypothetical protein